MTIEVNGDIFEIAKAMSSVMPVIVGHGVNRQGLMGAGIAKTVRDRYPLVYARYKDACRDGSFALGQTQLVYASQGATDHGIWMANMFTQDLPGPDARMWAVERAVKWTLDSVQCPVLVPEIGAGIGGLDPKDLIDVLSMFSDRLILVHYR